MKALFVPAALLAMTALALAEAPRTADGHPDLSGVWTNATLTPLERPAELGGKAFFTPEEARAFEAKMAQANNRDRRDGPAEADVARAYNEAWFDRGTQVVPTLRTSLIVEPADGRIPALTPRAQSIAADRAARLARLPEGPEDRLLRERCIAGDNVGPPMLPAVYNNNFQIFQNADYVVIHSEMMHDVRVIPLDHRPPLPSNIRQWLGSSRGRWEGNTLVVETTNFTSQAPVHGSDENLRVIERFQRVKPDLLIYQFRVEDRSAFVAPWAGEVPMRATRDRLFEYACHEGNRGLEGLLEGARAQERKEAQTEAKKEAAK